MLYPCLSMGHLRVSVDMCKIWGNLIPVCWQFEMNIGDSLGNCWCRFGFTLGCFRITLIWDQSGITLGSLCVICGFVGVSLEFMCLHFGFTFGWIWFNLGCDLVGELGFLHAS